MSQLVVANLLDGRIVKGTTLDASCRQPKCHIRTTEGTVAIELAEVKAIFFVRDHSGDAARKDDQTGAPDDPRRHGMCRVEVTFLDGEHLLGFVGTFPPRGGSWFMIPVDAGSNNLRVLVNAGAVRSMKELPAAGE